MSKTYVKKSEAGRLMAEVLRSSRAAIDAKLDQWTAALSRDQSKSRDQAAEQVPAHSDTELRQSYDNLRLELQVTTISTCCNICLLLSICHNNNVLIVFFP